MGTLTPAWAAAGAAADSATSSYFGGSPALIDVLANDTPSDGETLDATSLKLCGVGQSLETCAETSLPTSAGTYDTTSNPGQVTFTPARYFSGSADAVSYAVTDTAGAVISSTITVTVTAPTGPTSVADSKVLGYNESGSIAVLDNDSAGTEAIDTATLKICSNSVTQASSCTETELTITGKGTFTVSSGSVSFAPDTNFTGTVTNIKYAVKDLASQYSNLSTISVKVVGTPTAAADASSDVVNTNQNVSPLNNDAVATNSAGVTLDSATLALCSAAQSAPNCDQTTVTIDGKGIFTLSAGVVTFAPDTDYLGTATVDYQVSDTLGQTASATITFTVTAAPVSTSATDDTNTAAWDVTQSNIDVLQNDTAATDETFTANSVRLCLGTETPETRCTQTSRTIAQVGTYTANSDGTITFNPLPSYTGSNAIDYEVTDTTPATVRATLTVTVEAPTAGSATDDTAILKVNGSLDISVLANDVKGEADLSTSVKLCASASDTSGCDLTSLEVTGEGTYTVNGDGTIGFEPDADVTGVLNAVAYEAFDITGQSAGTATITVSVIEAPTAVADVSSADAGDTQTVSPLENDTVSELATTNSIELDSTTLKLCGVSPAQTAPNCNKSSLTLTAGTVTLAAGVVTFVPDPDFSGDLEVTYQVADDLGQVVYATITFTAIAPATAADDTSSDDYNQVQTVAVLDNDSATTGSEFNLEALFLCSGSEEGSPCAETEVEVEGKGTFAVTAEGEITFTPLAMFFGTATINYEVSDLIPSTVSATLTITVAAPSKPVLTADTSGDGFDLTQTKDVLANDTNHEADLDPTSVRLCREKTYAAVNCTLQSLLLPGVGYFTVDAETGEVTFNPSYKFSGDYVLAYTVRDVTGQLADPARITFHVNQPEAETINNDYSAGAAGDVQTIDVLANDNPGLQAFVLTSVKLCDDDQTSADDCDLTTYTVDGEGVYAVTASGKVTFTPEESFTGEAETPARYTAEVTDGTRFAIANIQVAVVAEPTGVPDEVTGNYDENLAIDVSANDTLSDLAIKYEVAFDPATIRLCAAGQEAPDCNLTKRIVPNVGIFTVDRITGNVLFNPSASFAGEAEAIDYQISDSIGHAISSSLTVTVGNPEPATLVADTSFAKLGAKQIIKVLANDETGDAYLNPAKVRLCDADEGDETPCSLTTLVVANQGTYTVLSDGSVQFVPLANATGAMTAIRYQVEDVTGQLTSPASITVSVIPKPVTVNDTSSVGYEVNAVKNVLTNDSVAAIATANGVTLVATSVRLCAAGQTAPNCTATSVKITNQGTYSVNLTNGVITFNPVKVFAGVARSVTYIVKDTLGQVSSATFTVTVANATGATIVNDTGWGKFGAAQKFKLTSNDTAGPAPLVAKSVRFCNPTEPASSCAWTKLTSTGEGTYTVNTKTGEVTFVPLPTFAGVASPVYYSVADITGYRPAKASLTVSVVGRPLPVADSASADYKQVATFTPTSNDGVSALATSKSVTLVANSIRLCAAGQTVGNCNAVKVKIDGEGTWRLNTSTRVVTFTPVAAFAGTSTALKYQVKDSLGQAQTANLVATIGYPDASILIDDSAIAGVAVNKTIDVVSNDLSTGAPISRGSLKLCSPTALLASACNLLTLTVAGEGTYTVSNGLIFFKSFADFSGQTTPVSYTVADITGQRASMAAISITVVDGPALADDESTGAYDVTQTISVLDNDTPSELEEANSVDFNTDSLRICAPGKSAPNCTLKTLTVTGQGTYTVNLTDSEVSFNPLPTFTGEATAIKYQIKDDLGNTSGAEITFTVEPADLGVLSNDTQNVVQNVKTTLSVLTNDTQGDAPYKVSTVRLCASTELTGAACSQLSLTVAGEGTYKVDTLTGKITFTSAPTFTGLATFVRYTVADITGQKSVPARITLTVNAVQ